MSWQEVVSNNKKPSSKEQTFILSDLINVKKCCKWCMVDKCKSHEENHYLSKMTDYIKKPMYIDDISIAIKNANFDSGKKLYFTTCIFGLNNGLCKNCQEGRIKYIEFKGVNIRLCYSQSENNSINYGIHDIDIELILKGKNCQVSAYPIVFENKYEDSFNERNQDAKDAKDAIEEIFDTDNLSTPVVNYEDLFPKIDDSTEKNREIKKMNYSNIILQYKEEIKEEETIPISKESLIEYSVYEKLTEEKNSYLAKIEKLETDFYIFKKKYRDLELRNKDLIDNNIKDKHIMKYREQFDEIQLNISTLNSIGKQFIKMNYEDYITEYA